MHIYSVSYTSYEDSSLIYLSHEEEYTKEEFEQIVFKAISSYLKAIKEGKSSLYDELIEGPLEVSPANLPRLLGSRSKDRWPCIGNIADLFPDIGIVLEHPNYGFKRIYPKESITFFGWQDPFEPKMSWVKEDKFTSNPLTVRLGEHLVAKGFTFEDSCHYEDEKRHEEHVDRHNLAPDHICPECFHPTRVNPLEANSRSAQKRGCWWCPACGAGCGCDDTQYSFMDFDLEDVFEQERDFEDWYGW